jgi:hypothetical protein
MDREPKAYIYGGPFVQCLTTSVDQYRAFAEREPIHYGILAALPAMSNCTNCRRLLGRAGYREVNYAGNC